MPPVNLITGDANSNSLTGGAGDDVIYGFDPDGPQHDVSTISATRVAFGLVQPLFATSPPGDLNRLFLEEKTGQIKILDLTTGHMLPAPFLNVSSEINI